jgi:transitional endoplasmic reticulum ATPase
MPAFIFCIAVFVIGALMSNSSGVLPSGVRVLLILLALGGLFGLVVGLIRSTFAAQSTPPKKYSLEESTVVKDLTTSHITQATKIRAYTVMMLCGTAASLFSMWSTGSREIWLVVALILVVIVGLSSLRFPTKKILSASLLVVLMMVSLASLRSGFDQSQVGLAIATGAAFAGFLSQDVQHPPAMNPIGKTGRSQAPHRISSEVGPGFSGVAGMHELKSKLLTVATEAMVTGGKQVRNGVLLHGDPGNGKTFIVEALAQQLKVPLIRLTYGDVGSKWVGETSEKVMAEIQRARETAPCVLFLDEADSLLEARGRSSSGGGGDYDRTVNTLLTEIVNLRGSGVLIIAATNFLDRLDGAAIREGRFDFKIEVPNPDMEARVALLRSGIKRNASQIIVAPEVIQSAGARWVGFSVKRILAITEQITSYAKAQNLTTLTFDDLNKVLREVQGSKARTPEGTKAIEELVLSKNLRLTLAGLVLRMKQTFEIEQAGGALPSGLLFSGPPGTGKTETARALSKSSGWAFLSTTGNDLLQDPSRIEKIKREAMDLRPALIFIDEADDLLMNREFSQTRNATNKLLAVMDGANGKVSDVIWIAATNHPENLDPAVLRGGRFAEKYEFSPPSAEALRNWANAWLHKKGWTVEARINYPQSMTIADGEAVLQQAINNALVRTKNFKARLISTEDLAQAFETLGHG